jgi:hypothetical protein
MIIKRADKGSDLSYQELDGNFEDLDTRTALGWRDNVREMVTRGSQSDPQFTEFRDQLHLLAFPPGVMTEVFGNFHIDHDYALGTALYPHIHWATNDASTGVVRWGVEWTLAKGHQQMAFGPTTTVYIEQAATGTPYTHHIAEVSPANAIPGTNVEPDTMILVRVFRDGAHINDTFADQVFGIALDLHYQADRATTPNKAPNFYV